MYPAVCICCDKKYQKITSNRDKLVQAVDLRIDVRIKTIELLLDQKILTVTARDIVATEAHYHKSCFQSCTRKKEKKSRSKGEDQYYEIETIVHNIPYYYYYYYRTTDLFKNPRFVPQTKLLGQVTSIYN